MKITPAPPFCSSPGPSITVNLVVDCIAFVSTSAPVCGITHFCTFHGTEICGLRSQIYFPSCRTPRSSLMEISEAVVSTLAGIPEAPEDAAAVPASSSDHAYRLTQTVEVYSLENFCDEEDVTTDTETLCDEDSLQGALLDDSGLELAGSTDPRYEEEPASFRSRRSTDAEMYSPFRDEELNMTFHSSGSGESGGSEPSTTNLIVNYFPQELPESEFVRLFKDYGPLKSCKLLKDSQTGMPKTYGFANFVQPEHATMAQAALNGLHILNKVMKVSFARPAQDSMKGANLHVTNISRQWTVDELTVLFSKYGPIVNSRLLMDKVSGNSLGVGFVRFENRNDANAAMQALREFVPLVIQPFVHFAGPRWSLQPSRKLPPQQQQPISLIQAPPYLWRQRSVPCI
ncbi:putative ELAV-like protein 3 [Hypsibius exemplaris]|uniref:Protein alan shepard n=1 Tax=Hypsibius exemplaris TaxID=2072580 RepID=A0A1W0WIW0_HYPEX|nr:putative ELAV-like protein 3 [Hypsibius exemplaris]